MDRRWVLCESWCLDVSVGIFGPSLNLMVTFWPMISRTERWTKRRMTVGSLKSLKSFLRFSLLWSLPPLISIKARNSIGDLNFVSASDVSQETVLGYIKSLSYSISRVSCDGILLIPIWSLSVPFKLEDTSWVTWRRDSSWYTVMLMTMSRDYGSTWSESSKRDTSCPEVLWGSLRRRHALLITQRSTKPFS